MSANSFSRNRENLILSYVAEFSYLRTSQVQSLAFCFPSGLTKCREVLLRMYRRKQLNRFREKEFIYFLGRKRSGWQSIVILNDLYFSMRGRGKVIQFYPELEFISGRCDGFFCVECNGIRKKFFVEVDRGTAPFKKASIYNMLLHAAWETESWADPLRKGLISFPLVVVMTLRRNVVEYDFRNANFNYHILDLYDPLWDIIFDL